MKGLWPWFLVHGLLRVWSSGALPQDVPPYSLPSFRFVHGNASLDPHRAFGEAMGKQFAVQISERFGNWSSLQTTLLPALLTDPGRELYDKFLRVHRQVFPNYVAELEGLASGANIPFSTVFTAQLAQEFAGQLGQVGTAKPDACSDYMLCSQATCGGAHNEDGSGFNINRSFVADVQLGGPESRFRAFVYAGELPSGAFGVNAGGVGFSLNWVGPPPAREAGLGRGFISRSLLDASDPTDALQRVTRRGQAGGHNYQLFDFCGRSVTNVEVDTDRYAVRPIGDEAFFHTNQYESLRVTSETLSNSSLHRLKRAAEMETPRTLEDMLAVLGDQEDQAYPIFHDNLSHRRGDLSDWTMATAVIDVSALSVRIMQGNPRLGEVRESWDVRALLSPGCTLMV